MRTVSPIVEANALTMGNNFTITLARNPIALAVGERKSLTEIFL